MKKEEKQIKRIEEPEHIVDTSDLWIVPYADFMTVIMIFFMLMFAFAYLSKTDERYKKIVASIQEEMGGTLNEKLIQQMIQQEKTQQMVSKFDEIIEKSNLGQYVQIKTDAEQIKIIFSNPVLFDIGESELKPESIKILDELYQIFKDTRTEFGEIIVEGHTDNVPISGGVYKSNWELSVARAMAVIRYFTEERDLDSKKFVSAGYGEYRPVFSNETEEYRAKNRRIEINILREKI